MIYVSHSSKFDYEKGIYRPIKESDLFRQFPFLFPHEVSASEPYPTKALFDSGDCSLVIAEVSYPSTGQGIELAWGKSNGIRICCLFQSGNQPSSSLKCVSETFIEYQGEGAFIDAVREVLFDAG